MKTISLLFFISLLSFDSFSQCDKYVKVVDRLTLKPVAYADVSIYDVDALSYPVYIPAITSDSSGIVKLSICPNRSYKVNANKDGYFPAVESIHNFSSDIFVMKMDRIVPPRYVKVVERGSDEPLDSFEVSFCHIRGENFIFVGSSMTDSNGLAKVPDTFGPEGKINANNISTTRNCLSPCVENVQNFDSGTRVIFTYHMTDCGVRRIPNVYFAYGSASLIDFYKENEDYLPPILEILMKNPKWKVELDGHTDNKEDSATHHRNLSQNRADNVKAYLISKGINKDRITTKAVGSSWPQAPNEKDGQDDPEGRARNRRVEFKIIPVD